MVTEIAEFNVVAGLESLFERAVAEARPHFLAAKNCHGLKLARSVEHPSRYRLLVDWHSVEDHTRFRATDGFQVWRSLAGPYFAAPPRVEHVIMVIVGDDGVISDDQ